MGRGLGKVPIFVRGVAILAVTTVLWGCATMSISDARSRCLKFGGTYVTGQIEPKHVCVLELTGSGADE